ncbi:MAG: NifB/NifX family molybdenum-iron cluster-binding protein [Actinomycetota bacterium]|nr:NifB/NifX family molybdenum-iron cluster-binding protein [Actinomycetota bacterium]
MKVAVSSTGPDLSAGVDPRFGRSQYFIIVDPETLEFEAVQNPNIAAVGGAGIQSAQLVIDKGVSAVLTGNCGPNAFSTLQAAGVRVVTGVTGTVREAVEKHKKGELKPTPQPSTGPRFGMGRGCGRGRRGPRGF